MRIVLIAFGGEAFWKLRPTDPPLYELPAHAGVQFISPLLFPLLEGAAIHRSADRDYFGFVGDLCLVRTSGIGFKIDENYVAKYWFPEEDGQARSLPEAAPVVEIAAHLLTALRYFSKQAGIRTADLKAMHTVSVKADDLPAFRPPTRTDNDSFVAKRVVDTAIARADIESACRCGAQFRAPLFDTLFLDAISADTEGDYRKSILYSAMAVEIGAATVLDERYDSEVRQSKLAAYRTIVLPQAGGQTIQKDPIWDLLRHRSDFSSILFHEAVLYLFGRSLLVENEPLFQEVTRLRATRNKIVHLGEPPTMGTSQYLTIDRDGSAIALRCAKAVLAWLGVAEEYKLPELGFLRAAAPSHLDL
jgi:hypothetical protein